MYTKKNGVKFQFWDKSHHENNVLPKEWIHITGLICLHEVLICESSSVLTKPSERQWEGMHILVGASNQLLVMPAAVQCYDIKLPHNFQY
jgi:hypothetical protein